MISLHLVFVFHKDMSYNSSQEKSEFGFYLSQMSVLQPLGLLLAGIKRETRSRDLHGGSEDE